MVKNKVASNIIMLYLMNIAQLILPLITLPYLARVLSVDCYGLVSYVKSVMMYVTLVVEFGFILSGTKEVVEYKSDKKQLGKITWRITIARLLLSVVAFLILAIATFIIPLLAKNKIFVFLLFIPVIQNIFLFDFLFRGLEKMHLITIRYIIMKGIATVLTFVFVKGNSDILLIPMLDIFGTTVAIIWIFFELKKLNIRFVKDKFINVWFSLKESAVYFASNMASTAFGAFNTVVVGICLSSKYVAYWGIIQTIITGIQSMYSPIGDGIYPRMINTRSIKLLRKILLIFTPLLILGCILLFSLSTFVMIVIGSSKYASAAIYLKCIVPLLAVSFYDVIFGWPVLGAISKVEETTFSTIVGAIIQVLGCVLLIVFQAFNLYTLILMRVISELCMLLIRLYYFEKYKYLFKNS